MQMSLGHRLVLSQGLYTLIFLQKAAATTSLTQKKEANYNDEAVIWQEEQYISPLPRGLQGYPSLNRGCWDLDTQCDRLWAP